MPAVLMPTSSVIEIEALLAPIAGDAPEGDRRAYAYGLRDQFEALRQEERPEDFDDATRPAVLKKPDWDKVVALAQNALSNQSKDLRVVCHLVEGLTKKHGFAGLQAGLELLRRLLEEAWDRLVPDIDDGDLDSRAAPLANMLDDPDRGLRFPTSIRFVPLFGAGAQTYGLIDWNRLRGSSASDDQEATAAALRATDVDLLAKNSSNAEGCLQELQNLVPVMDHRLGSYAPSLANLGAAIHECAGLMREELARMQPGGATASPSQAGEASATAVAAAGTPDKESAAAIDPDAVLSNRAAAYAQLQRAAEVLQQMEPHSPIPYLVRRAVELGRLPFPRLMQQLIRDTNILMELNRELGIEEPAAS